MLRLVRSRLVLYVFTGASALLHAAAQPTKPGHVHVDQFGYLPAERKIAVLSDPQLGFNAGDHYTPGNDLELRSALPLHMRAPERILCSAAEVPPFEPGCSFSLATKRTIPEAQPRIDRFRMTHAHEAGAKVIC